MRVLGLLAWLMLASSVAAQPTVYTLQSAPGSPTDFTAPCAIAPCANFPSGAQITGSFTTNAPLAPNLPGTDILASITSFLFNDGIQDYDSTNADVRVFAFIVSTNGSGVIGASNIQIQRWKTGSAPHGTSDRLSAISLSPGFFATAANNRSCTTIGPPPSGAADTCTVFPQDASTSLLVSGVASFLGPPLPPDPPRRVGTQAIPTMSSNALALLALLLAAAAWTHRRLLARTTRR